MEKNDDISEEIVEISEEVSSSDNEPEEKLDNLINYKKEKSCNKIKN